MINKVWTKPVKGWKGRKKIKWEIQCIEILTTLIMTNHKRGYGAERKRVIGIGVKVFFGN